VVSPDGERLAYVDRTGTEVLGYTVELRSRYRVAVESASIDGVAWSPDSSRLAYRVIPAGGEVRLRVRSLLGAGAAATVAIGAVDTPRWQADGRHLVFSATVPVAGAPQSLAFRVSIADAATAPLTVDEAIPTAAGLAIRDPVPSPDGHQLAFLQPTVGGDQVAVMNVDGTGLVPLTAFDATGFPYSCSEPAWTRG
jgi:Tol biopolymer transport system component